MSDRGDERISEPPALEGELDRWYDLATDRVVAVLGTGEMCSFIPGVGWIGGAGMIARSTAIERLAAELAACRARREGAGDGAGDGERIYHFASMCRLDHPVVGFHAGEWTDDWGCPICDALNLLREALPHLRRIGRKRGMEDVGALAEGVSTLLARRATATTATPAGEET